jgi:predicted permease
LLRDWGFTATAVLALTLGIGATSAIFSVIYGVLLKPLPYSDPDALVRVYESNPSEHFELAPLSPGDFLDFLKQNRAFDSMATFNREDQQYGGEHPERLIALRVSYDYFRVFRVDPTLGRTFTEQEEDTPAPTNVAIISHNLWRRLFASDPQIIGKTIRLTDYPFQIIGVMPPGFEHMSKGYRLPRGERVDVWLPFSTLASQQTSRAFHYCHTIARLNSGVAIDRARAEINAISAGLQSLYPDDKNWRAKVEPMQTDMVSDVRLALLVLAGAVGFVLLVACGNVTNLLLARATVREREMTIRTAVGATRTRLIRQLLTESITLSGAAGILGILIAYVAVRVIAAAGPEQVPRLNEVSLNPWVILVTVGLSILAGVLSGVAPALAASKDFRRGRPRGVFVVAEVALTFVLLVGAGLLLRSFLALGQVDPGFNPSAVLTANTTLSYPKLLGARRYVNFYETFVEKLEQLPGVTAVGATSNLPWTGGNTDSWFAIEGRARPTEHQHAHRLSVSPDYLRAMGIPLEAGRGFTLSDHFDAPKVVIVNKSFALQQWPSVQASIGQRVDILGEGGKTDSVLTIVGVAGDVKDSPTDLLPATVLYQPLLQAPTFRNNVALRASIPIDAMIPAVRQIAHAMGNDFRFLGQRL